MTNLHELHELLKGSQFQTDFTENPTKISTKGIMIVQCMQILRNQMVKF